MVKISYIHSIVVLLTLSLWATIINADKFTPYRAEVTAKDEYTYYGHAYNSDSDFPKARARDILQGLETDEINQLQQIFDEEIIREQLSYKLYHTFSVSGAKLLLYYGANPVYRDADIGVSPINGVVKQAVRKKNFKTGLTHDEIIEWSNNSSIIAWPNTLASDTAINLTKLYVALGETIYKSDDERWVEDPLWFSLYAVNAGIEYDTVILNRISIATEVLSRYPWSGNPEDGVDYYGSPVTGWIQKFIAADQSVTLLDTHPLLYLRFMRTASLEDVVTMLNNPEAHKIPINSNCPYRGADIESGITPAPNPETTCPLTPSINMRDAMGRTPLHLARMAGNDAVYDYLIAQGADTSIKDFRGYLASSLVRASYKLYEERKLALIEEYFASIAGIPFPPSVKLLLPEFRETMTNKELIGEAMNYGDFDKFLPLLHELEKYNKLDTLPTRTKASIMYRGHYVLWQEKKEIDKQTQNKNKNMQLFFTTINDIEFSPSVNAQLTDIEKILIKITIHERKPSDEELEKLNALYEELQQHDALHALPRLTQYYIRKYRAQQ